MFATATGSQPCTLHPARRADFTLHPAPCTLHPTTYTLYPTPYTLLPKPLNPEPSSLNPTLLTLNHLGGVAKPLEPTRHTVEFDPFTKSQLASRN